MAEKIMHKIILSCKEATKLVSINKYHKLSQKEKIQLKLHLMVCKFCKEFSIFNDYVDETMQHIHKVDENISMSEEKKEEISTIIKDQNSIK